MEHLFDGGLEDISSVLVVLIGHGILLPFLPVTGVCFPAASLADLNPIRKAKGRGQGIPDEWRPLVIKNDGKGGRRINRTHYEICVLQAFRAGLRCKEIW